MVFPRQAMQHNFPPCHLRTCCDGAGGRRGLQETRIRRLPMDPFDIAIIFFVSVLGAGFLFMTIVIT
jgi:hypothetical protein